MCHRRSCRLNREHWFLRLVRLRGLAVCLCNSRVSRRHLLEMYARFARACPGVLEAVSRG
ncbi:hypothetical protein BJX96DRAFT_135836 [Aspergillus floccosus]